MAKTMERLSALSEIRLVLTVFMQFYKRHLWLFLLFVFGLSLGSALLGSIQGLNQEATDRYQQTSALINNPISHFVRPSVGREMLTGDVWTALRNAGVVSAEPVLEGVLVVPSENRLRIKGVNTLQWLSVPKAQSQGDKLGNQTASLQFGFSTIYVSDTMAQQLSLRRHEVIKLLDTDVHFAVLSELTGDVAIADIALVDHLLNSAGRISYIEISNAVLDEAKVRQILGDKAQLQSAQAQSFDSLSKAFFFNLQALAFLGYVVGAFLSFNAIKLCLHARKKLHQQLTLLGCIQANVVAAVVIEVLVLSLIAALVGAGVAFLGANLLVSEISMALESLFALDRRLPVNFSWLVVLQAFVLNLLVLASVAYCQVKPLTFYKSWQSKIVSGSLLVTAAGYFYLGSEAPFHALGLCVCLLLLFFMITPVALWAAFKGIPTQHPLVKWMKADSVEQIRVLAISVYAVLLAVGTSVGLQIMVSSFSSALQIHLDGRLSADLYVRPSEVTDVQYQWLLSQKDIEKAGVFWRAEISYGLGSHQQGTQSASLISFGRSGEHHYNLTLLAGAVPNNEVLYYDANKNVSGCLANEPSKLLYGVKLGQRIRLQQGKKHINCEITGFYYDYGEQRAVFVAVSDAIENAGLNYEAYGFSIVLKPDIDTALFKQKVMQQFHLNDSQVVQNQRFKQYATRLFEHTFYATHALNLMIVAIALFGLWVSLLTLGAKQIQPLAILKTLGVTTWQAFAIKLGQSAVILLVSLVLATILGGMLGWILLKFVMPIGFGWTIPFLLPYLEIAVFITLIFSLALLVSVLPLLKLSRHDTADLLYED
ncbi:FtsX-like permease family protein [Pseudoalteromonas piscicida]|uniref:ABC transporter permease n=1 Tax=Pseudoalteromonas piscicida TaxID=43662 RepID=UPI003C7D1AC4